MVNIEFRDIEEIITKNVKKMGKTGVIYIPIKFVGKRVFIIVINNKNDEKQEGEKRVPELKVPELLVCEKCGKSMWWLSHLKEEDVCQCDTKK